MQALNPVTLTRFGITRNNDNGPKHKLDRLRADLEEYSSRGGLPQPDNALLIQYATNKMTNRRDQRTISRLLKTSKAWSDAFANIVARLAGLAPTTTDAFLEKKL